MSIELQIIEYKDCMQCDQSIDRNADLCPFCRCSQDTLSKIDRFMVFGGFRALLLTLAVSVFFVGAVHSSNNPGQDGVDLDPANQRSSASDELERIAGRLEFYTELATKDCVSPENDSVCSRAIIGSTRDSALLAELIGAYESIGRKAGLCDQLRPGLLKLGRVSSTEFGGALYNSYVSETASCWL